MRTHICHQESGALLPIDLWSHTLWHHLGEDWGKSESLGVYSKEIMWWRLRFSKLIKVWPRPLLPRGVETLRNMKWVSESKDVSLLCTFVLNMCNIFDPTRSYLLLVAYGWWWFLHCSFLPINFFPLCNTLVRKTSTNCGKIALFIFRALMCYWGTIFQSLEATMSILYSKEGYSCFLIAQGHKIEKI
jgi:hypothetical protein